MFYPPKSSVFTMSFRTPSLHKRRSRASKSPSKAAPAPYSVVPTADVNLPRIEGLTIFPRRDLHAPGGPFAQPVTGTVPHDPFTIGEDDALDIHQTLFTSAKISSASKKKTKQWERWKYDIIPSLVKPYLQVLQESQSLRTMEQCTEIRCDCGTSKRKLNVTCVYFDSKQYSFFESI